MRFLALATLAVAFSFPSAAQTPGPRPDAERGRVARFLGYVGHHAKGTVTDMFHDKQWTAMVFITAAAQTADTVTTCRGLNAGFRETNPLFLHTRSCAKFALGANLLYFAQLTAAHASRDEMVKQCTYDKESGPHQSWWTDGKHGGSDPAGCKVVLWLPVLAVPSHIMNAYNNEKFLDRLNLRH